MSWKLPRKRKKAFIREHGRETYRLQVHAHSLLPGPTELQQCLFPLQLAAEDLVVALRRMAESFANTGGRLTNYSLAHKALLRNPN